MAVRALLAGLAVRLLWWVLPGLLTVGALLAWIGLLRLPSARGLAVRLLRWILSGLLLPVRIGLILSVGRLLPVVAHSDKISAQRCRADGLAQLGHLHCDEHFRATAGVRAAQRCDITVIAAVTHSDIAVSEPPTHRRVVRHPAPTPPLNP